MTGWTQSITACDWQDLFISWFCLVDDVYRELEAKHGAWRRRGPAPRFSDSEVITIALVGDTLFGGHEAKTLNFVRHYHLALFPKLLSPSRFNRRRNALAPLIEQIRQGLLQRYNLIPPTDHVRLLDSLPLPLCTYQRSGDCQTIADAAQDADRSIKEYIGHSSKDNAFFAGCRLVVSMTLDKQIEDFSIVPAGPHDSMTMHDLLDEMANRAVLADNGYRAPKRAESWERRNIQLLAAPRSNSRDAWSQTYRRWHARKRRLIESGFSILCDVLHLQRPGSRSWRGFLARTATQLLAYTLLGLTANLTQIGALHLTSN